jgi:hypothetical protein
MKKQILIVGSGFAGMWAAVSAARVAELNGSDELQIAVLAPTAELRVRPRFYEENVAGLVAPLDDLFSELNVEFIAGHAEKRWIQQRIESVAGHATFSTEEKKRFLSELTAAEGLERYLGAKFPGAKRFSLEGGDALVPMLKELIRHAGKSGTREVVLGMAHRGRLNCHPVRSRLPQG